MALHVALDFLTFHVSAALHIAGNALAAADIIAAVDGAVDASAASKIIAAVHAAVDIPATGDIVPALPDIAVELLTCDVSVSRHIAVDVVAFNIPVTNNISINARVAV